MTDSGEVMRERLRQEVARMEQAQRRISTRAERSFLVWLMKTMQEIAPETPNGLLAWLFGNMVRHRGPRPFKAMVKVHEIEGKPVVIAIATVRRAWGESE